MSSIFNERRGLPSIWRPDLSFGQRKKNQICWTLVFRSKWNHQQCLHVDAKTGMWLSRERLHRNYFKQLAENSQWVYEDLEGLIKDRARWHNRIKKIRSITTITMTITRMRLIQKAQKTLLDITNYIQKESEQRRFTFTSVCQC